MSQREERESIWSVDQRVKRLYFLFFSIALVVLSVLTIVKGERTLFAFLDTMGMFAIGTAIVCLLIAEGIGTLMVWIEKAKAARDEARQRAREAEARAIEAEARAREAVARANREEELTKQILARAAQHRNR